MRYPTSISPVDLQKIAKITAEWAELSAEDPAALVPDPTEAFFAESMDLTWDTVEGKWDSSDFAIAYQLTPRALAALERQLAED